MNDNSRVWIFAADRQLNDPEVEQLTKDALEFTIKWTAHKVALKSKAEVLYNTFLIVSVDEDVHNASGCSIDAMHGFIKEQGKKMDINFFDRLRVVYQTETGIQNVRLSDFEKQFSMGQVNHSTLVFNTLIDNRKSLEDNFLIPVNQTWLAGRLH